MNRAVVIAEIGCNHKGSKKIAKDMIRIAKDECGVDVVKFQKREISIWAKYKPEQYYAPHPNTKNSYGETYKNHREFLELDIGDHKELKEFCDDINITYSCSVWDLESAKKIASLEPNFIKVPSACNLNYKMLKWLIYNFKGEIHISTGMTTKNEIDDIVDFFIKHKANNRLVLYNCVSGYPVPNDKVYLREITNLINKYGDIINQVGFSGHHIGTEIDIAAYTLGANYIERHFTLDRAWKGTDHIASLDTVNLKKLVESLVIVSNALKYKTKDILDMELIQREKLKWIE